ncbi:peptidylprolyl isomerase [Candidatus Pelagibacter sp.]|nr:peptidylprolyl isomerase [Candidatus Pelagibacter sp.]
MKIIIFTIILINFFSLKSYANESSFIAIKVNNNIITNIDLKNEENYLVALNNELKKLKKSDIEKIAKESVIREKIKEDEVNRYAIQIDTKYVDQIITNFLTKLDLETEQQFDVYLKQFDLTIDDVRKKIGIETSWNDLIFQKFNNQVNLDKKKIENRIKKNNQSKKIQKKYLLSEIVFEITSGQSVNEKYQIIKNEIINLGFKNTANKFSIADTAKFGGKIGWVEEHQLSETIRNELKKIKAGQHTKPINIVGGQLILKLEEEKIFNKEIDYKVLVKNALNYERNKQLNQFSKVYFNKIKINSIIDEK